MLTVFALVALTALAACCFHLERRRSRRELERLRIQLARDLHDDAGATLSKIALLSDVLCRRMGRNPQARAVEQIGSLSREAVDSLRDIVWSIDPRTDTLDESIERMRDLACEALGARNIVLSFRTSRTADLKLSAQTRRQLWLVFKEGVNNIARHSGCMAAQADLCTEDGWLQLRISDNGKGFDIRQVRKGQGLDSMRERARSLGGEFQVASGPWGSCLTLRVPIGSRAGKESTWKPRIFASASSKMRASRASC
jgi:signal transduction histidine kinase